MPGTLPQHVFSQVDSRDEVVFFLCSLEERGDALLLVCQTKTYYALETIRKEYCEYRSPPLSGLNSGFGLCCGEMLHVLLLC